MKSLLTVIVALVVMLFWVSTNTINSTPVTGDVKKKPVQEETDKEEEDSKEAEAPEEEEEEEEELDYELGKVDTKTKKATRYVCDGCGEVQLSPFKCEICEKDAKKEELDVEEKKGKWFIKGTNTQVVEKEPEEEEEEEEPAVEVGEEKEKKK